MFRSDGPSWHRAQATAVPDDDVAELERSASRAQARGGVAAAAAFLELAAELSLDPAQRIERTLAAARVHLDEGATDRAADLLTTTGGSGLDEFQQAEADLLRGRIAFVRVGDSDGPTYMLRAAQRLATLDPDRSRESYLEALEMGLLVGRATGVMDMVLAAAKSSPSHDPDVLDALTALETDGYHAAVPVIREALDGAAGPLWTRHPALAGELWDPDTHVTIIEWLLKNGREAGSPLVLRLGLAQAATAATLAGDLDEAMAAIAEEEAIADATGGPPTTYHRLQLAAMRGRREEAAELFEAVTATATGLGQFVANVHWARAVLHNGLAEYREALAAWLRRAGRRQDCRFHLRTAHELLSSAGLEAFARRAAGELRATGETARSRSGHARDQLTMQELHIARLVAAGATSKEVAARLFISPRTVDTHLRNIFRKLGITSRRQLKDLPDLRSSA